MVIGGTVFALLVPVVFLTSALSGVFGMAGGIILMAVLLGLMPLTAAMILHAVIQAVSNGWRCILWRRHIVWRVLPFYLGGVAGGFAVVAGVNYVPDKAWALMMMGTLPLLAIISRRYVNLRITNNYHAFGGAIVLTFIHMTAGVVGPLLDTLYNQAPLTRQEIVSTKAFTQTFMHVLRFGYYMLVLFVSGGAATASGLWTMMAGVALPLFVLGGTSVAGTSAAALLLKRWNDTHFKMASHYIILAVSILCLTQGVYLLLT